MPERPHADPATTPVDTAPVGTTPADTAAGGDDRATPHAAGLRVAVVGATGNAGTALLRALTAAPEVSSVLGIARRMPDETVEPYASCEWASIDIAAASSEQAAADALREAFAGVDTVVHLAWLIQPIAERELLRRVNVEGTRRVLRAAAEAGVGHVVIASSVGVYAADPSRALRSEDWERGGIESSQYSVDKVAQEKVLDDFASAHPDVVVTRMRPALIFQGDAASSIQRYFLGSAVPVQALGRAKPPALPLPKGLRGVQAVHSDDAAAAFTAAVVQRAPGAFNVCADDVLGAQQLADIIDHGRYFELPTAVVRGFVTAAHRAGIVSVDAGWFDLGLGAPHMDNSRAKRELGWEPKHSAESALRELLQGMIDGRGTGSLPLRARDVDDARLSSLDGRVGEGAEAATGGGGPSATAKDPSGGRADGSGELDWELFGLYLSDHLTGATAGAERMERMSAAYIDTPVYAGLSELAEELRLERAFLAHLIDDLEVRRRFTRQAAAWVGERVGRLKLNGRTFTRSPLSLILELELLRSAVIGKLGLWQVLSEHAPDLDLDASVFDELGERALAQAEMLGAAHAFARSRAFRDGRDVFGEDGDAAAAVPSGAEPLGADAEAGGGDVDETPAIPADPDAAADPEAAGDPDGRRRRRGDHDDALADEWGEESFPGSDPPANY
ncbi:NAD-dependent epimerase/dehydratase family protein [Leucobacter chromiiresistens]|uniref:Nucleoside-diphosphate-sugar epimerase n=2 Tax=Leucobacter chromiiresistens TaxID=1079994 RepID=A0A1H0ZE36_9MICO|nr:NAD-dependent epimerase/dehydratase family protein [Leucobacter chromiiresistens]SDQ25662.1 Nucleoside-diphosphate-sugar epimerase [Leucobacter chromiiresistens]